MAQLVFEFWSKEIEPVVEAISRILDGCPTENTMAPLSLHYEPTQEGLSFAAQLFRTVSVSSFVLRPKNNAIRYAMLNGPDIGGVRRPGCMGTIEYIGKDTTVRLKVEENQLVDVFSEIGFHIAGLKST